jgi:hypothetical protein
MAAEEKNVNSKEDMNKNRNTKRRWKRCRGVEERNQETEEERSRRMTEIMKMKINIKIVARE